MPYETAMQQHCHATHVMTHVMTHVVLVTPDVTHVLAGCRFGLGRLQLSAGADSQKHAGHVWRQTQALPAGPSQQLPSPRVL